MGRIYLGSNLLYDSEGGTPSNFEYAELVYTRVSISTDQDVGTSYDVISWDVEENDDLLAWVVGDATKLTVPANVTSVELVAHVVFANSASGTRRAKIVKNGTTIVCEIDSYSPRNEAGWYLTSGELTVSAGDYFELFASASDGSDLLGTASWGGPAWFEMRVPVATYNRCEVGLTGNYNHATTWGDIPWGKVYVDTVGAWSSGAPTRLTVPAGYTHARLRVLLPVVGMNSYAANALITKNATGNPIAFASVAAGQLPGIYIDTGWLAVDEDDFFIVGYIASSDSADVYGDNSAQFGARYAIDFMPYAICT